MLSCTRNNLDLIKYLIENKADLKHTNKDGWTAFHIAVRYV
jgi:ankyrin repeat protein